MKNSRGRCSRGNLPTSGGSHNGDGPGPSTSTDVGEGGSVAPRSAGSGDRLSSVTTIYDCAAPAERREGLDAAAAAARRSELVVVPTDTVYGLGADAFDSEAVNLLLATKGRGPDMPVPVLIGSWSTVDGLVTDLSAVGRRLVEAFWPGGLSLVVAHAPSLRWNLGDTAGTVMLRMVGPMAVSSANRSGSPAAQTAQEAHDQLGNDVPVYLDGGPAAQGVASTIVDLTGELPRVLREGAVPLDAIREVAGAVDADG